MKKLSIILIALLLAAPVLAVDYFQGPPPGTWQRGEPGSTFQHWTFDSPVPMGPPFMLENPYGISVFDLVGNFEFGEWECPPEMDPSGFVHGWHCIEPDGGAIVLRIPNTEFTDGEKRIFIQITSSKAPLGIHAEGFGNNSSGYGTDVWPTGLPLIQWGDPAPYGGHWYTYNMGLLITPNPQEEVITIDLPFCTVVDQIVVDTICTGTVPVDYDTFDGVKALFR